MIRTIFAAARAAATAALLAVSLAACASGGNIDSAKLEQAVDVVDIAYTTASNAVVIYCVSAPASVPCKDPGAKAEIAKAQAVLGAAIAKSKADIRLAKDVDALTVVTKAAMDALAVYAKVMATYGVNTGSS